LNHKKHAFCRWILESRGWEEQQPIKHTLYTDWWILKFITPALFTWKRSFCHHLLALVSFQITQDSNEDTLRNVSVLFVLIHWKPVVTKTVWSSKYLILCLEISPPVYVKSIVASEFDHQSSLVFNGHNLYFICLFNLYLTRRDSLR